MKKLIIFIILFTYALTATAQKLAFNNNGEFKVIQFTDLHYGSEKESSKQSNKDICAILDSENPDLVVFTGDVVCEKPVAEGWQHLFDILESRNLKYAITLGNHDDEHDLTREEIAYMLEGRKGSMFKSKVRKVYGYGNYTIPIYGYDNKKIKNMIYCFDSNSYSQIESINGYDYIKPSQISWYNKLSAYYKSKNKDIAMPSVAFFHIPLPEHSQAYEVDKRKSGLKGEGVCSPKLNSGLFANMVMNKDIYLVSVGHDHINDYTAQLNGIALSYGRFSGRGSTYGNLDNGAKVFVLKEGTKSFETYVVTAKEGVIGSKVQLN